jgi:hypothetical protein
MQGRDTAIVPISTGSRAGRCLETSPGGRMTCLYADLDRVRRRPQGDRFLVLPLQLAFVNDHHLRMGQSFTNIIVSGWAPPPECGPEGTHTSHAGMWWFGPRGAGSGPHGLINPRWANPSQPLVHDLRVRFSIHMRQL